MTGPLALHAALVAKGFELRHTGGGCQAFVRLRLDDDRSDVVTSTDGGSMPAADDWLLCSYAGDWSADDCGEPVDHLDSDSSPVDLIAAVGLLTEADPLCGVYGHTDTGRGVCADCGAVIPNSPYA